MHCVIVVYLTAYDDGNDRDEYTGMRGSGLTWRKGAVLGAGASWLEGKNLRHCYQMDASNSASGLPDASFPIPNARALSRRNRMHIFNVQRRLRLHTCYIMYYDSKSTASTSSINDST
ncbi:hypothetical protein M422DRAFT_35259 [Sphaerobolus stellatus SS14]|uniref:Unplaced genomic scaffold SPHSTscaffold_130, whole genome shotgun sequence n=1 Tax=Sphaerobolus stellatus (strain SS14) TaxID=990650 RepID=A0A0C9TUE2_SPHS4|nr:hypothetical protein M422DRAFT_35259 [Sphaerobolus stellatus SS14]